MQGSLPPPHVSVWTMTLMRGRDKAQPPLETKEGVFFFFFI